MNDYQNGTMPQQGSNQNYEKEWVFNGKPDQYGRLYGKLFVDKIEDIIKIDSNGRKYITLYVAPRKEVGKYGDTHYGYANRLLQQEVPAQQFNVNPQGQAPQGFSQPQSAPQQAPQGFQQPQGSYVNNVNNQAIEPTVDVSQPPF